MGTTIGLLNAVPSMNAGTSGYLPHVLRLPLSLSQVKSPHPFIIESFVLMPEHLHSTA
jgi:hypothetical protein